MSANAHTLIFEGQKFLDRLERFNNCFGSRQIARLCEFFPQTKFADACKIIII